MLSFASNCKERPGWGGVGVGGKVGRFHGRGLRGLRGLGGGFRGMRIQLDGDAHTLAHLLCDYLNAERSGSAVPVLPHPQDDGMTILLMDRVRKVDVSRAASEIIADFEALRSAILTKCDCGGGGGVGHGPRRDPACRFDVRYASG